MSRNTNTNKRSIRALLMALWHGLRRALEFRIPPLDSHEAGNRQEIQCLVRSQGMRSRDFNY